MTEQPVIDVTQVRPEQLAVSWVGEVLEDSEISAQDNFLDLGGHSLLAMELNQRVKNSFGVDLDIRILFERSIGEAFSDATNRAANAK